MLGFCYPSCDISCSSLPCNFGTHGFNFAIAVEMMMMEVGFVIIHIGNSGSIVLCYGCWLYSNHANILLLSQDQLSMCILFGFVIGTGNPRLVHLDPYDAAYGFRWCYWYVTCWSCWCASFLYTLGYHSYMMVYDLGSLLILFAIAWSVCW